MTPVSVVLEIKYYPRPLSTSLFPLPVWIIVMKIAGIAALYIATSFELPRNI
jgi:hypothetical protein